MTFEKQLITLLLDGVYSVAWIDKGNSWGDYEDIFLSHTSHSNRDSDKMKAQNRKVNYFLFQSKHNQG